MRRIGNEREDYRRVPPGIEAGKRIRPHDRIHHAANAAARHGGGRGYTIPTAVTPTQAASDDTPRKVDTVFADRRTTPKPRRSRVRAPRNESREWPVPWGDEFTGDKEGLRGDLGVNS